MSFKMKTRHTKEYAILAIDGEVSGREVVKIHKKLDAMRETHEGAIAVDLSNIVFMDSHGLGVLIYIWKIMEQEQRKFVFLAPGNFVQDMLETTNLNRLIRVVESEEQL